MFRQGNLYPWLVGLSAAFFSFGCNDEPVATEQLPARDVSGRPTFANHGAIIVDGVTLRPPRPYDPLHDPPPLPDSHPDMPLNRDVPTSLASRGPGHSSRSLALATGDIENDAGYWISTWGIYTGVEYSVNMINQPAALYIPAQYPSQYSCIEAVFLHFPGVDEFVAADWCPPFIPAGENMRDPTWKSKYVSIWQWPDGVQRETIALIVVSDNPGTYSGPNNCWRVLLGNNLIGWWEEKARVCGTSHASSYGYTSGWTVWEGYDIGSCPSIPTTGVALWSKRGINGQWTDFTGSDLSAFEFGNCWTSNTYTMSLQTPQYWPYWRSHTPN